MQLLQRGARRASLALALGVTGLAAFAPGEHVIEAKYIDKTDQMNGPYTLRFSTENEQMAQGKMMLNASAGA